MTDITWYIAAGLLFLLVVAVFGWARQHTDDLG